MQQQVRKNFRVLKDLDDQIKARCKELGLTEAEYFRMLIVKDMHYDKEA